MEVNVNTTPLSSEEHHDETLDEQEALIKQITESATDRMHADAIVKISAKTGKPYWSMGAPVGFMYYVGESDKLQKWQKIALNKRVREYESLSEITSLPTHMVT